MSKKIVCIVGRTCSGKDTISKNAIIATNAFFGTPKYKLLVSYTTRPKRPSEKEGREHYFIDRDYYYPSNIVLAYTNINGYEYFTTTNQLEEMFKDGITPVYIIDPIGLKSINKKLLINKDVEIHTVYITAPSSTRLLRYISRGITTEDDLSLTIHGESIEEFMDRSKAENKQFKEFEKDMIKKELVDLVINNNGTNTMAFELLKTYLINLYASVDWT